MSLDRGFSATKGIKHTVETSTRKMLLVMFFFLFGFLRGVLNNILLDLPQY